MADQRLTVAQAKADLAALVADVRARRTHLLRPGQQPLRVAAASALALLGEDRHEAGGVRLVLIAARVASVGDEHVVTAASYVKVSLDPLAVPRAKVVSLAAYRRVTRVG